MSGFDLWYVKKLSGNTASIQADIAQSVSK